MTISLSRPAPAPASTTVQTLEGALDVSTASTERLENLHARWTALLPTMREDLRDANLALERVGGMTGEAIASAEEHARLVGDMLDELVRDLRAVEAELQRRGYAVGKEAAGA